MDWCAAVAAAAIHQPGHSHRAESTQPVNRPDGRGNPDDEGRHWAYCLPGLRKHALRSLEQQWEAKQLAKLKSRAPILLIEHDMDAIFALADRISVLVYGRIIASGTVDEIRSNADVREAYLGSDDQ